MSTDALPIPADVKESVKAGKSFLSSWTLAFGLLLAHVPLLFIYGQELWKREHYQFFPLALIGFVYIALTRVRFLGELTKGNIFVVGFLLIVNFGFLLAAVYSGSPWLGMVSALWAGVTTSYAVGGSKLLWAMMASGLLLLLICYPPLGLDKVLIRELQILVSRWGGRVLDVVGVTHVMSGNVVQLPGKTLLVEEACSGINSFFSTIAVTLFFCLWQRRHWFHSLLLLTGAICWVIWINIFRVALLAYCQSEWGIDLLDGWRHDAFGLTMFAIAILLVWSSDRCLLFFSTSGQAIRDSFRDRKFQESNPSAEKKAEPKPSTLWPTPVFGLLPSVLVVLPFLVVGLNPGRIAQMWPSTFVTALPIEDKTLPKQWNGWEQTAPMKNVTRSTRGIYGDHSHAWTYKQGPLEAEVSLDYGFTGWHELTDCYIAMGWKVDQQKFLKPTKVTPIPFAEVELRKGFDGHGYLLFGLIDSQGRWLEPEPLNLSDRFQEKFFRKRYTNTSYQVQVFVTHTLVLTDSDREKIQALFQRAAHDFQTELIRQQQVRRP